MARLVRVGNNYWTVVKKDGGMAVELEQWPKWRVRYHTAEWLEWLGCEGAQWEDHTNFE